MLASRVSVAAIDSICTADKFATIDGGRFICPSSMLLVMALTEIIPGACAPVGIDCAPCVTSRATSCASEYCDGWSCEPKPICPVTDGGCASCVGATEEMFDQVWNGSLS